MTQNADTPVLTSIGEHYVVDRVIGRGGMATVYLCRDTRDDTRVAVKVLRKELGSAIIVERFLREIAFASELNHPRIPRVLDSGVIDGLPYYAMTYVEGESLKHKLERENQLPLDDAIGIACQVIAPTAYAHSRGIVHRDIKPDNVLIAADGVYVLDFGLARAIIESGVDRLTSTGVGMGTPAYMSPEQALGDRTLDARSDVYSLGCLVYEMIAGIPPFVGPTSQAIISRRFAAPPPPLSHSRDSVPKEVEDAVQRALARSPADRWPSVTAFGEALEACSTQTPGDAVRTAKATSRNRSVRRIAVAAVILAVIAAGIVAWYVGNVLLNAERNVERNTIHRNAEYQLTRFTVRLEEHEAGNVLTRREGHLRQSSTQNILDFLCRSPRHQGTYFRPTAQRRPGHTESRKLIPASSGIA